MARRGYRELVDGAEAAVETLSVGEAAALLDRDDVQFVDVRDRRELEREGRMPGALHAPRGTLEFWIDPDSPYHRPEFGEDRRFVFYCASGWRSALATATRAQMGLDPVAHLGGGFTAWRDAGAPVEDVARRG